MKLFMVSLIKEEVNCFGESIDSEVFIGLFEQGKATTKIKSDLKKYIERQNSISLPGCKDYIEGFGAITKNTRILVKRPRINRAVAKVFPGEPVGDEPILSIGYLLHEYEDINL